MTSDGTGGAWLSIVGIGEDGVEGLVPSIRSLIASAALVAGGRRHLQLVEGLARGRTLPWSSPMDASLEEVLAQHGQSVVVLASGDPFEHGVGALLARRLEPREWASYPQPSAFSLAANRMGWALQDVARIGLNGRAIERLRPLLQPGARILALSTDGSTPGAVARYLASLGFGPSRISVLEAMGGPHERSRAGTAAALDAEGIAPLNTLAIEVIAEPRARILPLVAGLPDDWLEHDGQITKREHRAITLSSLAPRRGEHLWDIGCGSGSVAIEWMLSHASCRATGIERRAERAARAARNALALGVPGLRIETGNALDLLPRLDDPQAVFIGGGAREHGLIEAVWLRLPAGGRLVVNAVTLETEAVLLAQHARLGGSLTRISIDRADAVGGVTGWRSAMPVLHWVVVKP